MILGTLIMAIPPAYAAAGTLYLEPATINWESPPHSVGDVFAVEVRITDVTDLWMVVFSVTWDPAILDLVKPDPPHDPGDPVKGTVFDAFEPSVAFMPNTNHAAGVEDGCAYTIMGTGMSVDVGPAPGGLVATMTFKVLMAPEAGSPIDTDILFDAVTHDTLWVDEATAGDNPFASLAGTHFHCEVVTVAPYPPTAKKTHYPTTPKVNQTVTFDASGSEPGWDGDGMCPIIEYRWDFGDGTPQLVISDPVTTHNFTETGTYHVCLEVYAPGSGFIDPDYYAFDEICQDVSVIFVTGLVEDVMTCSHPRPWKGEGPGEPCDAFAPQQDVCLCSYVTYNDEPVQNKDNVFEVHGPINPYYNFTFTRTATTNETGYACISFGIPWPCEYPEGVIIGDWIVYASCEVRGIIAEDYMEFKVGWLIEIIDMETGVLNGGWTPQSSFKKGECIGVKLTVKNIAFTEKVASFTIVVYDDLGVPIAYWKVFSYTVHPGEKDIILYCYLFIPKWAFIGVGTIYANAFKNGTPYCHEASTTVTLAAA